jgi:hypothetical protein
VGLASIIPQIFWPSGDAAAAGSCAPTLRDLTEELMQHTSRRMATAPSDSERDKLEAWLADWDHRMLVARSSCNTHEQPAWAELLRLRHGMHALIERFDREEAPRIRKLDTLLSSGAQTRHAPLPKGAGDQAE